MLQGEGYMTYPWDPELETGHEKIDNQHKQLFDALNNFIDVSMRGNGENEIYRTMDFLAGYTIMHFSDEEKLQEEYDYPDYLVHKHYHDAFRETVEKLIQQMYTEGPSQELVDTLITTIGSWLLNHIKGDDFRMATYIKSKEKAN